MTLTELRYVVNLDKERHFARAAERSFVSQPTLSMALKKLEDELGVILFERTRGEVKPTLVGERIVEQAKRVLAEAQRVQELARDGKDDCVGPLRLGAIYTVGPYLLPTLIPELRRTAPRMPLVIEENFTAMLLEQLRDNELDVAILSLPIDTNGLSVWPLYDEDFIALLPQDHRWAKEASLPSKRLAEEPLLLLGPGHCFRDQVLQVCPKCVDSDGDGPRPHSGSSLETIRYMVASGLGITVLPCGSIDNRPTDGQGLVAVPISPTPRRRIAMVWRKSFPRLAAIRVLRDGVLNSGVKGVTLLHQQHEAS
jgi:LysR family hydrogen peroxide-inducible transcriptional activator